jgi:hypothetical protein
MNTQAIDYGALLNETRPEVIHSEQQNAASIAILEKLDPALVLCLISNINMIALRKLLPPVSLPSSRLSQTHSQQRPERGTSGHVGQWKTQNFMCIAITLAACTHPLGAVQKI